MNGKERVIHAIKKDLNAGPPFDLGSTCNTTITKKAYINLERALGIKDDKIKILSQPLQIVDINEEILVKLGVDTRGLFGKSEDTNNFFDSGMIDEWGIKYRPVHDNMGEIRYYEMIEHPLSKIESIKEIEDYILNLQISQTKFKDLREKAKKLAQVGKYAIVGHAGDTAIFENSWYLRGMDNFFIDLMLNRKVAEAILEMLTNIQSHKLSRYLDEVGDYLDIVVIGDDLGGQQGPLISPELYKKVVKPFHKKYISLIKSKTNAKLLFHCCGAISQFLPDLIDIGVDIINPVQVIAANMDPKQLKNEYGKELVFWGAIDTQWVLPKGNVQNVREEVNTRIEQLHDNGGYIVSAVHNIQDDVPPENILAMADAIKEWR